MINTVIFDLDGVIVDTEYVYDNWMKEFLDHYQIFIDPEIRKRTAGQAFTEFPSMMVKWWTEFRTEPITEEEIIQIYDQYIASTEMKGRMPYKEVKDPDIIQVMAELKEKGYQIAIASSSPMEDIRQAMLEIELEPYVNLVISGEMFRESKPNPEIYLYTVEKLGKKPCECIAVEDSTFGIQAAKSAGLITFAKRDERFYFDQTPADFIIDRLSQLTAILCPLT